MKGAILILGGLLLLSGVLAGGGGDYQTSPLFSFQIGDVASDPHGPSKPKGFLASLFSSGLTGGGGGLKKGIGSSYGGSGSSGGAFSSSGSDGRPTSFSSGGSGSGRPSSPNDSPLGPGGDGPGPLNYPAIQGASTNTKTNTQPANALLLTSQGTTSGLSVPGGIRPSSPSSSVGGGQPSFGRPGFGGPRPGFGGSRPSPLSSPTSGSSVSSGGQMTSFVGTGPGGGATVNDIFGPSEGYKPGPPPGYGGPFPPRRGPPRSRFPAMFSWGDSPRRPAHKQPGQSFYKGSASESIPVRIGSAIMGLFGGGGNPSYQGPQAQEDINNPSFSNFYSVPPQTQTDFFTQQQQQSSPQGKQQQLGGGTPTLASRPGMPFPSLTLQQYERPATPQQYSPPKNGY